MKAGRLTKLNEHKINVCLIQCFTNILVGEGALWGGTNIVALITELGPSGFAYAGCLLLISSTSQRADLVDEGSVMRWTAVLDI